MTPVYQRIVDPGKGDCFKCCLCTLLDLPYEAVPNFIEDGSWLYQAINFCRDLGYDFAFSTFYNPKVTFLEAPCIACWEEVRFVEEMGLDHLKPEDSINGLFMASVYSPGYTNADEHPIKHLHQVLCDVDCNVVFDPNPNYQGLRQYPYAELIGYNGVREVSIIKKL